MSHLRAVGIEIGPCSYTAAWVASTGRSSLLPLDTPTGGSPCAEQNLPLEVRAACRWRAAVAAVQPLLAAGAAVVVAAGSRTLQQQARAVQSLAHLEPLARLPRTLAAAIAWGDTWGLLAKRPDVEEKSVEQAIRAAVVDLDESGGDLAVFEFTAGVVREVFAHSWSHASADQASSMQSLQAALKAGQQLAAFDQVLLLAPAGQISMAAEVLQQARCLVDHRVHPAEAVARGAALYADAMRDDAPDDSADRVNHFAVLAIAAAGVAVELVAADPVATDGAGTDGAEPRPWGVIPPLAALPASATFELLGEENQPAVVRLLQATACTQETRYQPWAALELPAAASGRWQVQVELPVSGELRAAYQSEPDTEWVELPLKSATDWPAGRLASWDARLKEGHPAEALTNHARLEILSGWPAEPAPLAASTVTVAADAVEPWPATTASAATTPWGALENWSASNEVDSDQATVADEQGEVVADRADNDDDNAMAAFASDTPARVTRIAPDEGGGLLFMVINLFMLVLCSAVGLLLAYYILCWIDPGYNYFKLTWWGIPQA